MIKTEAASTDRRAQRAGGDARGDRRQVWSRWPRALPAARPGGTRELLAGAAVFP